jgi:hypothetical protein
MENDKLQQIAVDIAEIKVDLSYHIKRCDLLETSVEVLKKDSNRAKGAIYFIGFLGTVASITDVVIKIFHR